MVLLGDLACAADPDESLPPPRTVPVPEMVLPPVSYVRPNPYDVWNVYAVDRSGRFRPRVV